MSDIRSGTNEKVYGLPKFCLVCLPLTTILAHMECTYLSLFISLEHRLTLMTCPNKALINKLLKQGYRYHKLHNAFSKFYRHHSWLVEKYNVSLKKLLQQGISEPELYSDKVYFYLHVPQLIFSLDF